MKKNVLFFIIALCCTAAVFAGGAGEKGISVFRYDDASMYIAGGADISGPVEKLDVDWVSGSVKIVPVTGSRVRFTETSSSDIDADTSLYWWLDGTTLKIRFCKSGLKRNINYTKDLVIQVPRDLVLEGVEIFTVSAGVKLEVKTKKADIQTVSGTIVVNTENDISLEAESVSGNITINASTAPSEIKFNSVSGDAVLNTSKDNGFTARFNTVSGKVKCGVPVDVRGNQYTFGEGGRVYRFDTVSGGLVIAAL